jgi:hypothetical protein
MPGLQRLRGGLELWNNEIFSFSSNPSDSDLSIEARMPEDAVCAGGCWCVGVGGWGC